MYWLMVVEHGSNSFASLDRMKWNIGMLMLSDKTWGSLVLCVQWAACGPTGVPCHLWPPNTIHHLLVELQCIDQLNYTVFNNSFTVQILYTMTVWQSICCIQLQTNKASIEITHSLSLFHTRKVFQCYIAHVPIDHLISGYKHNALQGLPTATLGPNMEFPKRYHPPIPKSTKLSCSAVQSKSWTKVCI